MLTPDQIHWAATHDWFVRDNGNGTITVVDDYMDIPTSPDGYRRFFPTMPWNDTFRALRIWAGY